MAAAPPTPASIHRAGGGGHHTPAAAARPRSTADSATSSSRARARWSLLTTGAKAYRLERLLRRLGAKEWAIRHQAAYRGFRCRLRLLVGRGGQTRPMARALRGAGLESAYHP